MRLAIIAFVAGVVWLQWHASLPASWHFGLPGALAGLLALRLAQRPGLRTVLTMLAAFCLGVALASTRAEQRLASQLDARLEGQALRISGTVEGLPQTSRHGPRLRLLVDAGPPGLPERLLLNDYARPAGHWQPGQRWQLTVRLKRPHGTANPGSFDYAAWLLAEDIGATGSIARQDRQLLDTLHKTPRHLLHHGRAWLAQRIHTVLAGQPYAGVIVALVVGEQSGISTEQWALFRATGITHLVSISGLHITLVASLLGGLAGRLWRRSARLCARWPARHAALLAGVLAALAYSLLAGFSVPTQRTLFMLGSAGLALLCGRHLAISTIWCLALGTVVLLDPWAVLAPGCWLSFLTVGAMLWALAGSQDRASGWRARLQQWGKVQWAATLGSLPLLLVYFQQLPLASPLANALAIPLISGLVTPLALLGSLEPSGTLLHAAQGLLQLTGWLLQPLAQPQTVWQQAQPASWTVLPAAAALLLLLMPRGLPARWLAGLWLLPLLVPARAELAEGQFRATVFDVGQGLAVLVQTPQHALLYDAGPEGSGGRVLPGALQALGLRRLDTLLLSHDDGDHVGGAAAVLGTVTVAALYGAQPRQLDASLLPARRQPCLAGQHWRWDGVDFRILHPGTDAPGKDDNARSCVLRISSAGASLLLPGDIGRHEEADLLAREAALASTVLLMPHHGSAQSSSPAFVAAVAPQLAIASNGYRNPFRHPRPEVLARYAAAGAQILRTDQDGAIVLDFDGQGWQARAWRSLRPRYWQQAAPGPAR